MDDQNKTLRYVAFFVPVSIFLLSFYWLEHWYWYESPFEIFYSPYFTSRHGWDLSESIVEFFGFSYGTGFVVTVLFWLIPILFITLAWKLRFRGAAGILWIKNWLLNFHKRM